MLIRVRVLGKKAVNKIRKFLTRFALVVNSENCVKDQFNQYFNTINSSLTQAHKNQLQTASALLHTSSVVLCGWTGGRLDRETAITGK